MTDDANRRRRRSPARPIEWRLTAARIVAVLVPDRDTVDRDRVDDAAAPDVIDAELWEATNRAFFVARRPDGTVLREMSAGNGYLRDHDHLARHQVLRSSFDLDAGLAIVRGAMGLAGPRGRLPRGDRLVMETVTVETNDEGLPVQLVADGVTVTWEYERLLDRFVGAPSITRRLGYTWEMYAYRGLEHLARSVLRADWLPMFIEGGQWVEGFLYANSWFPATEAHVFWRLDAGDELELIVSDTDPGAEASPLDSMVSRTGRSRMVDVRGPDAASVAVAAAIFRLDDIAAVDQPMQLVEMNRGTHQLVPAPPARGR